MRFYKPVIDNVGGEDASMGIFVFPWMPLEIYTYIIGEETNCKMKCINMSGSQIIARLLRLGERAGAKLLGDLA